MINLLLNVRMNPAVANTHENDDHGTLSQSVLWPATPREGESLMINAATSNSNCFAETKVEKVLHDFDEEVVRIICYLSADEYKIFAAKDSGWKRDDEFTEDDEPLSLAS